MIVAEDAARRDRARRHPALLCRFAERGSERRLVAIARPAWQPPGAAMVAPPGTALQQHGAAGHVGKKSGRAIATPVPVAECASDPAVPVPASHLRPVVLRRNGGR